MHRREAACDAQNQSPVVRRALLLSTLGHHSERVADRHFSLKADCLTLSQKHDAAHLRGGPRCVTVRSSPRSRPSLLTSEKMKLSVVSESKVTVQCYEKRGSNSVMKSEIIRTQNKARLNYVMEDVCNVLQMPVVSAVDRLALVYDRWKKTEPTERGNKREGKPRSRRMRERRRRREVMMEEEESYKGERE